MRDVALAVLIVIGLGVVVVILAFPLLEWPLR